MESYRPSPQKNAEFIYAALNLYALRVLWDVLYISLDPR